MIPIDGVKLLLAIFDRLLAAIILGSIRPLLGEGDKIALIVSPGTESRVIDSLVSPGYRFQQLVDAGKTRLVDAWKAQLFPKGTSVVAQNQPLGPGHAVLQASDVLSEGDTMIIFPDNICLSLDDENKPVSWPAVLREAHRRLDANCNGKVAVVGVKRVPEDQVHRYGVVGLGSEVLGFSRIEKFVEKPSIDQAPSNFAAVGYYILPWEIFDVLARETPPGKGGELQLTDAIAILMGKGVAVFAVELPGEWLDVGTPEGVYQATEKVRRLVENGILEPTC
jgi:UTP--glucose-1-phosphate uridylyltransferase